MVDDAGLKSLWDRTVPPGTSVDSLAPGATHRPPATDPPADGATQVVRSGYDVAAEIGRGGMGVVFRAHQASLDRDVALKRMRPELKGTEAARRLFVSEALATGALDHPNIVPVHDISVTADGDVSLSMKLVGGTSWKDLLHPRGAPADTPAADLERHLEILLDVANAVAFAHSRGIVHRDLKPENVMVGEFGEVLVMDWGLAVDIGQKGGRPWLPHHDDVDEPAGTPSYMAPESAEGRGRDIGARTDVYLLGAILHEILVGTPPHAGKSTWMAILAAARGEPPEFGPDVPRELADICRRTLARDPKDRHASVLEFQEALRGFLRHRESLFIAARAERSLGHCVAATTTGGLAAMTVDERHGFYGEFAEVVSGFRQARALWDGNLPAKDGERRARLAFAKTALAAGDLGLAQAQISGLDADDAEVAALGRDIAAAAAEKAAAVRRLTRLRRALIAAAILIVVGSLVATWIIRRSRDEALENLRRFNQLGDVERHSELLVRGERDLWPRVPELAAAMTRWLADAAALHGRMDEHRAALAELDAKARRAPTTTEDGTPAAPTFDDPSDTLRHRLLLRLVDDLSALPKLADAVGERRRYAEAVTELSIERHREAWSACIAAVRAHPHYGGLELRPQLELVPLGENPATRRFEFWHVGTGERPHHDEARREWTVGEASGLVLVLLPAGTFDMGAQNVSDSEANYDRLAIEREYPVHEVALEAFFVSKYEMTQAQWLRATGVNPSRFGPNFNWGELPHSLACPVEGVDDWGTAMAVLRRLRLALPTEAQWEYAARAGTETPYWTGEDEDSLEGAANVADLAFEPYASPTVILAEFDDGAPLTADVGYGKGNAFGIYNVHGNVAEWCRDRFGSYALPFRPGDGERVVEKDTGSRVVRGGSFSLSTYTARSSCRTEVPKSARAPAVGIRPVRAVDR